MAFDTSMYRDIGSQPTLSNSLAELLNRNTATRKQENLLAQQQQRQNFMDEQNQQLRDIQMQSELAKIPALKSQQEELKRKQMLERGKEFDLHVYGMLESGIPKEQIMQSAMQKGIQLGFNPDQINSGLAPLNTIQDQQKLRENYLRGAAPEKFAEMQINKMKPEEGSPVQIMRNGKPLIVMSKSGRVVGEGESKASSGSIAGTKAPSGYRFTQDGELEPIPGGPADIKSQMLAQQKGMATEQASITSQQAIDQAAQLYAHPGRAAATGASSFLSKIPGTAAKGFEANLATFKAQTFIPMVSALKGMGALSDAEGKKLVESVGALDPSMPEAEFEESLRKVTRTLYDKAKASGLNVSLPDFAATSTPVQGGYDQAKEARYQAWKAKQGR